MEKIVCNVLYKSTLFFTMKDGFCPNYVIGSFAEKDDAIRSTKLILSIFKDFEDELNLVSYGAYRIDKFVKPESYTDYYTNIYEFIKNNEYAKFFLEQKGTKALKNRLKEIDSTKENEDNNIIEAE